MLRHEYSPDSTGSQYAVSMSAEHKTSRYSIQQGRAPGLFPDDEAQEGDRLHWLGGAPGSTLEDRWVFSLRRGDERLWRAAVLFDPGGGPFIASLVWEEAGVVLFGGGATIFAVDLVSGSERLRRQVSAYFGEFELDPESAHLYVLGCMDIQKFDRNLRWLWTSEPIAVDGITLTRFSGQWLHVSAERDPPGGWVPVTIDARTGKQVPSDPRPNC